MNLALLNLVTFYLGWFACVWGAASQHYLFGPGVTLLILMMHFSLMLHTAREARLILTSGLLGFCLDTFLAVCGVLVFHGPGMTTWLSPPWMVALWMLFATTFHTSLRWLAGRQLIAVLLGVLGGPASYYAGAQLGALTLHPSLAYSLGGIAIAWGGVMPILLRLAYNDE